MRPPRSGCGLDLARAVPGLRKPIDSWNRDGAFEEGARVRSAQEAE